MAGSLRLTDALNVYTSTEGGGALPSIAVGPESFVVATNARALLYSKDGRPMASIPMSDFFGPVLPADTSPTDMRVLFDERRGRFLLVGAGQRECQPPSCTTRWMVAVSRTERPTSLGPTDWHHYGFDGSMEGGVPTGQSGDFNVVSLTEDKLVLVGISIPPGAYAGTDRAYAKIWVFEPDAFLAGGPVVGPLAEYVRLMDPLFGRSFEKTYPAVTFGSSETAFLVAWIPGSCSIGVVGITGPAKAPVMKVNTARAVRAGDCRGPLTAPQLGGGVPLDTMPQIETPPVYRDGRLWLVQSILHSAASGPVAAVRLVELDVSRWPAPPTFVIDVLLMEDDVWYFNPALTVDPQHNVALVAHRSSPREYGSVWVSGRRADDPPGTLRPAVPLKQGEANWNWSETSHEPPIRQRNLFSAWAGAAIDPIDHSAWVVGQATRTACQWELWVGRTDFTVVAATTGTLTRPALTPVRERPCTHDEFPSALQSSSPPRTSTGIEGPLTLRFIRQLPVGSIADRPQDIPIAFDLIGTDLGRLSREEAGRLIVSGGSNGWTSTPEWPLVLLLPGDATAGTRQVAIRLPDGREARTSFEVSRP